MPPGPPKALIRPCKPWLVNCDQCCFCFDRLFFLFITWSGAKCLLCFSFVSGHQELHDQGGLREGVRILRADILPQCFASSVSVHRCAICSHKLRLCETRKNDDRLRSERLQTDRSIQPICWFILAKKINHAGHQSEHEHFYYSNEVGSHHGDLYSEE